MSDNKSWLVRNWKLLLNVVTIVALLLFVYAIRRDLGSTIENLAHVHAWTLLLLIPMLMRLLPLPLFLLQ